jgi:hypothetical protein
MMSTTWFQAAWLNGWRLTAVSSKGNLQHLDQDWSYQSVCSEQAKSALFWRLTNAVFRTVAAQIVWVRGEEQIINSSEGSNTNLKFKFFFFTFCLDSIVWCIMIGAERMTACQTCWLKRIKNTLKWIANESRSPLWRTMWSKCIR